MNIKKNRYYAIINVKHGKIIEWFNNRVYLGKWVMLAYNQIPDKENYKIFPVDGYIYRHKKEA